MCLHNIRDIIKIEIIRGKVIAAPTIDKMEEARLKNHLTYKKEMCRFTSK